MSHAPLLRVLACSLALAVPALATDFECRWAATPPKIDGKLDDPAWQNAQVVEDFQAAWLPEGRRQPPTATKARLLWDREYLYFSAEMEDTDVFANVTEQDGATWLCDVFEFFFKPAKDKPGYFEFEVNAANTKLDMFLPSRGSGGYARHGTDRPFHVESAVEVRGTLNNFSDKDKGWTVEGRVPWRDFLPTGGRPAPGEVWQHQLCRYDYSAGFDHPALSTNLPAASETRPDFHRYEDYVPLKFVGPPETAAVAPRPLWDTSKLVGSPEPPHPFHTVNAFPKLKTTFPLTIVPEPGGQSYLLLETNGYNLIRKSRLLRLANDPNVAEPEVLLEFDETIFDAAFHPDFAKNGYLFIGANGRFGEGRMEFNDRLLRYKMDPKTGKIDPASRTLFLEFHSHGHNGMALVFGKDGMLYMTTGDGTSDCDEWSSGQDLTRLLAKLLRIDVDHPSDGKPYGIPKDNPFLGLADARPETWAYGFRNPWRMRMDPQTGDLWVGENGQDLWEYARIAHRGANYGWPLMEGSHELNPHRPAGPTPISGPLVEHPHTDFRSLTGGIVYRGKEFPELVGRYVYGDFSTGQIWAATLQDGKVVKDEPLAKTSLGITNFCEAPNGDLLVVDYNGNAIHKLERAVQTTAPSAFPLKLSETGLFTDTGKLQPHPGLLHYDVIAPGWHDGAAIDRFLALPGAGRMDFTERGGWVLPDGGAVVQTLTVENKRVETRVLLRQQGEWTGYSYAWNDTQTDAALVPKEGATRGDWRFPSRQECAICHSRAANFLLSVSTPQLNRKGPDGVNQITRFEQMGLLKFDHTKTEFGEWKYEYSQQGLNEAAVQEKAEQLLPTEMQRGAIKDSPLLPRPPEVMAKLVDPRDETASVHDRARAYLHVNCSHCHTRGGGGNSNMQLASNFSDADAEIANVLPLHSTLGLPDARLAAPGAPERSLLILRPAIRGPNQMPPFGSLKSDADGVALLAKWIGEMKMPEPAK